MFKAGDAFIENNGYFVALRVSSNEIAGIFIEYQGGFFYTHRNIETLRQNIQDEWVGIANDKQKRKIMKYVFIG
jgi:hypothetical protein